jgi:protein ImuB
MSARIVCIDIPSLPLQILRRDHPAWAPFPLAVIAEDRPQASVLSVSRRARDLGVRPGMRYAAALAISRELRAAPVAPERIADVRSELVGALHRLSPRVEPDAVMSSVIWVDPKGMLALFSSYQRWAEEAQSALDALDLLGTVVVGFRRMPALAVARGVPKKSAPKKEGGAAEKDRNGIVVLASIDEERKRAAATHLDRFEVPPALAEALRLLGIRTLGELLALPIGEVSVRLGPEAARFHRSFSARGRSGDPQDGEPPLSPTAHADPIEIEAEIDPPDDDRARLLFCTKGALHALMAALIERRMALGALSLTLSLEHAVNLVPRPPVTFVLEPAVASRDVTQLTELMRLKLEALELPARVTRLKLEAQPTELSGTQLLLTESARRRDPSALARGLTRLRAVFGDDAVTRASLESSWAPEATFRWAPIRPHDPAFDRSMEPIDSHGIPNVELAPASTEPRLMRRVLPTPWALPSDGRGLPKIGGTLIRLIGPYRVQSGWWSEGLLLRDYFYAEREDGAILWLFRDQSTSHWFLQGMID